MTVSTWYQPNFTTDNPTDYKTAIDGNFAVLARFASMFSPYASSTPAMNVNVASGMVYNSATLTNSSAQQSSTVSAPSAGLTRIDRVGVTKASGGLVYLGGTASTAPAAPVYTSSLLPVAQILLSTATAAITNNLITDERTMYVF